MFLMILLIGLTPVMPVFIRVAHWLYPEVHVLAMKDDLHDDLEWSKLRDWMQCNAELVGWALSDQESSYFLSDVPFHLQPKMAEEKEVWERLLTMETFPGSPLKHTHCESKLTRLFQEYAPCSVLADRECIKQLCKKHCFGVVAMDGLPNTDFYFLMEPQQQNKNLVGCEPFQRRHQLATTLEASSDVHIKENFDPHLWHVMREFTRLPKEIDHRSENVCVIAGKT